MKDVLNIECVFDVGYDAWLVEVINYMNNVLETEEFYDDEFEEEVSKLRKKYEKEGYKVEVNIREQ